MNAKSPSDRADLGREVQAIPALLLHLYSLHSLTIIIIARALTDTTGRIFAETWTMLYLSCSV